MDSKDFSDHERMWTTDKERYVLIRPQDGAYYCTHTIYDIIDCRGFHIEDDALAAELVGYMLDAGVPVVDEVPAAMNPIVRKQLELVDAGVPADEINRIILEMKQNGGGHSNPLFDSR